MPTDKGIDKLLDSVKPLSDPLRFLTTFTTALGCLYIFVGLLFLGFGKGVYGLVAIGLATCPFAFALLISPGRAPNAFYLRSFRTDKTTVKLRGLLSGVLGPDYRLSGIRAPGRRTGVFLRFFAAGFFALRYAGSRYMELESGDDWMARLWKSYQSARVAFIDVRDITDHVRQEILLTVKSLSPERCIFLVDDLRMEDEWQNYLNFLLDGESGAGKLKLLNVSADRLESGKVAVALEPLVAGLPPGEAGEKPEGRAFVAAHISEATLRASRETSTGTVVGATLGIIFAVVCSLGMNSRDDEVRLLSMAPWTLLGLASYVLLAKAYGGLIRRAWRFRAYGHPSAPLWGKFAGSLFLGIASLALLLTPLLITMGQVIANAHRTEATMRINNFHYSLESYFTDYAHYPEGKTSTEIFRQLAGDNERRMVYLEDRSVYLPMRGKVKPAGYTLSAENVCFDVIARTDAADEASHIPMVVTTGFHVSVVKAGDPSTDGFHPETPRDDPPFYDGNESMTRSTASSYYAAAGTVRLRRGREILYVLPAGSTDSGANYRQLNP